MEKAQEPQYNGDPSKVGDVNRSVITVPTIGDLAKTVGNVATAVKQAFGNVDRVKFSIGADDPYNKVLVNMKLPTGGLGEIQLATASQWATKIKGGGEVLYNMERAPSTAPQFKTMLSSRGAELYSEDPTSIFKKAAEAARGGGFTMDLLRNVDYAGTPNIAVSPYPERTMTIGAEGVNGQTLATFVKNNADIFLNPKMKGLVQGGWFDEKSGFGGLDVVLPVPLSMEPEAAPLGGAANQIAGFNLSSFDEVPFGGDGKVEGAAPLAQREAMVQALLAKINKL
jgi:hypothetical protein